VNPLTIVMYHYVRDLSRTRYPAIKGRTVESFRRQLDYLAANHTIVTAEQVMEAANGGEPLPPNAAWLTFDDGYLDHYATAFPLLYERGWQGSFFPPSKTVLNGELLDVNRVHFILASAPDPGRVVDQIREYVETHESHDSIRPFASYWSDLAKANRMDSADVVFAKRVLQHGLPEEHRNRLSEQLFQRFVSVDAPAFAAELYMSADQLRLMSSCGMYIGSHGAGHYWMDRLTPEQQAQDVESSLAFLKGLGVDMDRWIMCYPYGAYNDSLLRIVADRGCAVGVTTRVSVASVGTDHPLTLPRLDTNDLPH
jgi:peptidoglycan/xylan/chitin deacetylase (PgdA/CDA1 family)